MKWIFGLFICIVGLYANPNVTVSIVPQKYFVKKIAGDTVDVNIMVLPGFSPARYEPKPKQMASLEKSDAYFAIGVPFEVRWLKRFKNQHPSLDIIKTQKGIEKIPMAAHHHHDDEHHDHGHHDHKGHDHSHGDHKGHDHAEDHKHHGHDKHGHGTLDPHVWLDPILVKTQAKNIYDTLVEKYPKNKKLYKKNLDSFLVELDKIDAYLSKTLANAKGRKFMVYHPAWGYFAKRYGLVQESIELEGKEPKPKALEGLIKEAKKEGIHTIFVQPQFSKKSAKLIAKAIDGKVLSMSPLREDWEQGLKETADVLAETLK